MEKQELLTYLKDNNFVKFQSKSMQKHLKEKLSIPKTVTSNNIRKLLSDGVIERKSISGNCSYVCASCYEYGCDSEPKPPINFYQIKFN